MKLIPLKGKFTAPSIKEKTIRQGHLILTNIQIGENGNSLLFVSANNKFHIYGINSRVLTKASNYEGKVLVYDFQNLSKHSLIYQQSKLTGIGIYTPPSTTFDSNAGIYKINRNGAAFRIQSGPGILDGIRKFFCQLFGGYWAGSVAENGGSDGTCYSSGSGTDPEEPTSVIAPGSGGSLESVLPLINNPNYFNINSGTWYSVLPWLGGGSSGVGSTWSDNTMFIDTACQNPDLIRTALFTLNTIHNQQPSNILDGSVEEMLQPFEAYKNQQQVAIPIIPWLIKAGANGSADALMQALFIYLTEDDCLSFGAAFGHDKFSKLQVTRSGLEGLIPWRTPGGKLGRAAFTAIGDVMINLIEGKYGTDNYQLMGQDFMLGLFSDLAGGAAGELASKYALPKIGKGLLNKFGIHYKTVASWLGGGLQQINKSFTHNGQTITASRIMKGFADNKVAVIGRNMSGRVSPFANSLSNELGVPVLTWLGFNTALSDAQNLANNQACIKSLKEQGYTFYDVGLDPKLTLQGNFDE